MTSLTIIDKRKKLINAIVVMNYRKRKRVRTVASGCKNTSIKEQR